MRGYQDHRAIESHRRPRAAIEVVSSKLYRSGLGEKIVKPQMLDCCFFKRPD